LDCGGGLDFVDKFTPKLSSFRTSEAQIRNPCLDLANSNSGWVKGRLYQCFDFIFD
jgi:hypothetical protein